MLRLWLCDFSKTASAEGLFTSVAVEDIVFQLTSGLELDDKDERSSLAQEGPGDPMLFL